MNQAIDHLVKGAIAMMHAVVLLKVEVKELQAANAMKQRRQRKGRISLCKLKWSSKSEQR